MLLLEMTLVVSDFPLRIKNKRVNIVQIVRMVQITLDTIQ